MVIFWIVLGATALLIFITAIEKGHHQITAKEQEAITIKTKTNTQEQVRRIKSKTNEILESERVNR